ncbi:MAG: hypothetical protein IPM11_01235 [Micropruina sp.]|nr:hypothetical protein [Micropruina sp.]
MTFKTFEQLDADAGPGALFSDYAKKPVRPDTAGYDTPDTLAKAREIADRSVFAAAFRQDNTVGSLMSRKDTGADNADDGAFDPVAYVKEHNLAGYEDSFMGVMNARRADAVRAQIEMEQRDRETLQASGWAGTVAQVAAGVFDAPALIPGSVAVRGAKGAWSVGRSALMAGASAGATQAATEGFLHATQETRMAEESYTNVGAAVVMGSLLGGGVAAVLGKNERITATKALESIAEIQSGAKPNEFVPAHVAEQRAPAAGGADVADGAFFVDPVQKARTRDELAVDGAAARGAVKATAWLNPVLRATQRYAASARQIADNVYESTIYRAMHSAGETTGASVEATVRTRVTALQAEAGTAAEAAYKEMRTQGVRMSRDDFYQEVGRAMRNNDTSDNPFVSRAAQGYRKLFDDFTKDALKLGLLEEGDLDVKTAASYFSRVYDRDKLLASEPEFLDVIGRHFADRMAQAYDVEAAEVRAARGRYSRRVEDVNTSGGARAARVDELKNAGKALDTQFASVADLVDELTDARGRVRAGDKAARDDVRRILAQGGEQLQEYLTQRAELRGRMRNLTERNPDAQAARFERLTEQMDDVQGHVERSLAAFGRRAKNLLNRIEADPVARAEEKIAAVEREVMRVQQLVERTQDRLARLAARDGGIEQAQPVLDRLKAQEQRLAALTEKLAERDAGPDAARALVAEIEGVLQDATKAVADTNIRRGERIAVLKERAAKLSPEEVKARAEAQRAQFAKVLEDAESRFDAKWGPRRALGLERGEAYDFEAAGKAAAKEIYDKITGKVQQRDDIPSFITKVTSGPLKDRTFMVPDDLLSGRGWLKDDVREVANRYSRAMAGEIELTRRFGRADMRDQLAQIAQEYSDLRNAVGSAKTVAEVNALLGRNKYGGKLPLSEVKLAAQKLLAQDEASAITDTKAGRDLIRGTYGQGVNNTNFASVSRSLMHFNYLRQMGGVLLANVTDFYRPAMVHGLAPYLRTLPDAMAQMFNAGSKGLQLSIHEAKLAGLVVERITHALQAANGDIADPFLSRATHVERFMQKATGLASRWNLVNAFTDAQQAIASTVSQHRILEAILGNAGKDGTFVGKADGERLLRMLGIDKRTQQDIAKLFEAHGQVVDGIRVANTERWLQHANETGVADEIARTENAVRAYRTAVNTDVNSIVSRRGLGDAPLFANHPVGKLLTQFSGYAMGAHSRVMIRGLQESHARLVGGLLAMTMLGGLTSYLAAWRGGRERWEKYVKETKANPALLIGEGLDRSGFFPVLFDFANRTERVSGAVGYDYRFNPVKSPIAALGGGKGAIGITSTRASDSAAAFGALLGPTAGMVDSALAVGRVAVDKAAGKQPPKHDVNQAIAAIPFQSYYGMREVLQVLTGNSNYTRH